MEALVFLLLIVIAAVIALALRRGGQTETTSRTTAPIVDPPWGSTPLLQHPQEEIVLWQQDVALAFQKTVSHGWAGASIRVARGFWLRGGKRVTSQEVVDEDTGHLFATDQRLVFMGRFRSLDFPRKRINGVRTFTDGYIGVSIQGRQNSPLFRVGTATHDWASALADPSPRASRLAREQDVANALAGRRRQEYAARLEHELIDQPGGPFTVRVEGEHGTGLRIVWPYPDALEESYRQTLPAWLSERRPLLKELGFREITLDNKPPAASAPSPNGHGA
jgi:hypothetical protein